MEDLLKEMKQIEEEEALRQVGEEALRERPGDQTEELAAGGREPPLPSVLQTPLVRHGKNSEHVLFISHEDVLSMFDDWNCPFGGRTKNGKDPEPYYQVSVWKRHKSFKIPKPGDYWMQSQTCFRMLVHIVDDRVVQLQQCCATQFEEQHVIPPEAWNVPKSKLVGYWEITVVEMMMMLVVVVMVMMMVMVVMMKMVMVMMMVMVMAIVVMAMVMLMVMIMLIIMVTIVIPALANEMYVIPLFNKCT